MTRRKPTVEIFRINEPAYCPDPHTARGARDQDQQAKVTRRLNGSGNLGENFIAEAYLRGGNRDYAVPEYRRDAAARLRQTAPEDKQTFGIPCDGDGDAAP